MANGDPINFSDANNSWLNAKNRVEKYKLLDGATGTTDGAWVRVCGARAMALRVSGMDGDVLKCFGEITEDTDVPAATDGYQFCSDVTQDGLYALLGASEVVEYVRASVSTYGAGDITAVLMVAYD